MAEFYSLTSNDAADRRVDLRIAKVELGGAQIGAGLLHVSGGRVRPGAGICNLLRGYARSFDLSISLDHEAARFCDPLSSRNNRGAIGFHCLSGCSGFRFTGIVVGARDLALFDERQVSNAIPLGPGIDCFVLLQLMLRGNRFACSASTL